MRKYKNLYEALKDFPKTLEEFKQRQEQENSSTSENPNSEEQEPTNKYEVRFVKYPPKK